MLCSVSLDGELLPADVAGEVPLSAAVLRSNVVVERRLVSEGPAGATLARVHEALVLGRHVPAQARLAREALAAILASAS